MSDDTQRSDAVADLMAYIDVSPTPWHAVRETARRLEDAGYRRLDESESWSLEPGDKVWVERGGSIAAFEIGTAPPAQGGFRLVGAHTDSPNLRIKPSPDVQRAGYRQLGVEVYGGVLLHTWLDRDLSLAGRVVVRGKGDTETHLVSFERPLMRIPSLAIHLNRTVNTEGLVLNAQQHLAPILGLAEDEGADLRTLVAEELGKAGVKAKPQDIIGWDLCAHDVQPSSRSGPNGRFLHAPRLDNLASCHAGLSALLEASGRSEATRGLVLYDHEEVGSRTATGAASPFLRHTLERVTQAFPEQGGDALARAASRSLLVSADMAHAVHPNYEDRHEPEHLPVLGRGPVVKIHASQAYATDGETWGRFEALCSAAGVTPQRFVSRNDMPCGSTIGPITAAALGIPAVDVGNPMLSMHSCREMAAAGDVAPMIAVLRSLFDGTVF